MDERLQLQQAIAKLEEQRETLGDAAVNAALAGVRQRLDEMDRATARERAGQSPEIAGGERRVLTILFCDVTGSTKLAEGLDPESWTKIMNDAFDLLIAAVDRFGGTVARLMGDAILAFFGAPTAHEDDPQRAVLAGLAILEAIGPYREQLRREPGIDFNVRVGINTGLAVVGRVGSDAAGEYTAMGDAVNVAARMEQSARAGSVQIAQDTYALVAPLFEVKALGGITVKGKSQPVSAYEVLGPKSEPGQLRGLGNLGISSPLVGREAELLVAKKALDRLIAGEGSILTILGEAGIGKSRLLAELHQAREAGTSSTAQLRWLEGHTLSYSQGLSYWPFQEILRDYAGINEEDGETAAWAKLESAVNELAGAEAVELLPYLASLLSLPVSAAYAERIEYLDAGDLGRQIYRATRLFFRTLAQREPLVLVFDDVHWMDRASAGLLEHLLPLVSRVPLLICGLSRPDAETAVAILQQAIQEKYAGRYIQIDLTPLSAGASDRLVHNLLEISGLPRNVRQMMIGKADGNPFYLEELVRELIASGAITRDPTTGRWQAIRPIEQLALPDSIQGLLLARIDRLDEPLKRVIRRAAVIGRSFLYRILDYLVEDKVDLVQGLDRLEDAQLIRQKQRIPELEYVFKHALAQEAAYDSILLEERRKLHARVGAAIEVTMADRLDEFYGLLAHHYSAAQQWNKAQEYLFKAGDQAGRIAADAEALASYRRAMDAYARVRGDAWDALDRSRLERKMGEALYRLGDHAQARTYLKRAMALLGHELPASRWGIRLAIIRAIVRQAGHRLLPALFLRDTQSSPDPQLVEIYETGTALGWAVVFYNAEYFVMMTLQNLNLVEQAGYTAGSASIAAAVGTAASIAGRYRLAERYFRLSATYAQEVESSRAAVQLEIGLTSHFNLLGELDKLFEHAIKGAELGRAIGDLRAWGLSISNLAWFYWYRGQYEPAREKCEALLAAAEESSDGQLEIWGRVPYGCILLRLGRLSEACQMLQAALEIASELPDYFYQGGSAAWLGRAYLALGEQERAITIVEKSGREIAERTGGVPIFAQINSTLCQAYLSMAEETSDTAQGMWFKKYRELEKEALRQAQRYRVMLPDMYLFMGRFAWLIAKTEAAQRSWNRALAYAQEMGLPYEESMIHLEIARRLGDRQHLQEAIGGLEALGATYDLQTAREFQKNI